MPESRRRFLSRAAVAGSAALAPAGGASAAEGALPGPSPSEYLMRQHGVVHRLALLFDAVAVRLEEGKNVPDAFLDTRDLVFEFTENYHEELEESYVFNHFAEGRLGQMATVLRMQHSLGHTLAQRVYGMARQGPDPGAERRRNLIRSCRSYSRMYRAHAAFEDTDLWPALRKAVSARKYADIRKSFHEEARKQLGDGGFSAVVERLAEAEKQVGVGGLSDYTPDELP